MILANSNTVHIIKINFLHILFIIDYEYNCSDQIDAISENIVLVWHKVAQTWIDF